MATDKRISIAKLASVAGTLLLSAFVGLGLEMKGCSNDSRVAAFIIMSVFGFGASLLSVVAKKRAKSSPVYKCLEILSVIIMVLWFSIAIIAGSEATVYMASVLPVRILIVLISVLLYFSYYFLEYRSCPYRVRRESPGADRYGIPL